MEVAEGIKARTDQFLDQEDYYLELLGIFGMMITTTDSQIEELLSLPWYKRMFKRIEISTLEQVNRHYKDARNLILRYFDSRERGNYGIQEKLSK